MTVVECRDLQVPRGERIVIDDLSLVVRAGEWVALVGPNGAGKTTFLHAVSALLPSSGSLSVLDHDPRTLSRKQLARLVALMPQHPVVPPGMVVRDLVMLGRTPFLGSFATESPADRAAVDAEIAHLGLESLVDRAADSLSGGELQRVMLASNLACCGSTNPPAPSTSATSKGCWNSSTGTAASAASPCWPRCTT